MSRAKSNLLLFLCAIIWGSSFVAQSVGSEVIDPFTYICIRNVFTFVALLPVFFCFAFFNEKKTGQRLYEKDAKRAEGNLYSAETIHYTLKSGIKCGVFLFGGMMFQQIGIRYTTVAKSGFLTAMYIIFIPILGLLIGKKIRRIVYIAVPVAAIGLYCLCITEGLHLGMGDSITILCAISYAMQIMSVDSCIEKANPMLLSITQFFVAGVIAFVLMLALEHPSMAAIVIAWFPLFYSGVVSGAMGYTLQIFGQKGAEPTVASLIMSMESVFSLIAGWIILGEACSARQLFGCLLMMTAIVLVQLPEKK